MEKEIPGSRLYVHGSFVTELYLPNSDIDLTLINEDMESNLLMYEVKQLL